MPQFATSTTAATAIPQNGLRVSLLVINLDATDSIFIDTTTRVGTITTSNAGIRLAPGAATSINRLTDGLAEIQDSYQVIASANTPTLAWFETESINRRTGKIEPLDADLLLKIIELLKEKIKKVE